MSFSGVSQLPCIMWQHLNLRLYIIFHYAPPENRSDVPVIFHSFHIVVFPASFLLILGVSFQQWGQSYQMTLNASKVIYSLINVSLVWSFCTFHSIWKCPFVLATQTIGHSCPLKIRLGFFFHIWELALKFMEETLPGINQK